MEISGVEDKSRSGQPKKFEDKKLEVIQQVVSVRLRAMGMIQK